MSEEVVPTGYFRCDQCHGVFEKGVTDDEAEAEAERLWGVKNATSDSNMAVICDTCLAELMKTNFN